MNLQDLGALLKRERERRGMTLRDVMDTTKISRRNLSALEEGQVNLLPHPVYLKGYIKNYARLLDLDPERLACVVDEQCDEDMESYLVQEPSTQELPPVEEFRKAEPGAEPTPADAKADAKANAKANAKADSPVAAADTKPAPKPEPEPDRSATAPTTSPFMAPDEQPKTYGSDPLVPEKPRGGGMLRTFLILVVLVGALGGLLYYYQVSYKAPEPPAPVAEPAPVPAPAPADNASDAQNATAPEGEAQAEAPVAPGAALPASRTNGLNEPAVAPGQPAAPAPLNSIVVEKSKAAAAAPAAPVKSAPSAPSAPAPTAPAAQAPTPGMQELAIIAKPGETCWVQFNDGTKNKNFTLQPGETRKLEFARYARVRLGNAGGVSFSVNGQAHPYQGQRGAIDVVEFGTR